MKSNYLTFRVEEIYPQGTERKVAFLQVHHIKVAVTIWRKVVHLDTIGPLKFSNNSLLRRKIIFKKGKKVIYNIFSIKPIS